MSDDQAKLRRGDWFVRVGEVDEGVRLYAEAARSLRRQGLALKAVAVWRQVRDLLRQRTSAPSELDAEARAQLIALYLELGLEADANALEMEARSEFH